MNADEVETDSVRRTRSGRAVKSTPVKKATARKSTARTRAQKAEIVEFEEEVPVEEEQNLEQLEEVPENGMLMSEVNVEEKVEETMDSAGSIQEVGPITEEQLTFEDFVQSDQNRPEEFQEDSTNEIVMGSNDQFEFDIQMGEESMNEQQQAQQEDAEMVEERQDEETTDVPEYGGDTNQSDFATYETVEMQEESESKEFPVEENESREEVEETVEEVEEVEESKDVEDESTNGEFKKTEPDTEAVSEDELPNESSTKEPETEAVSDEELPVATADLGETESVSEDELPLDGDKKKKTTPKGTKSLDKAKTNGGTKRKLSAEGEYDPNSPTSENNDETPSKKAALASGADGDDSKSDAKPASPKKKTNTELEKYWKAVNEDPSDFTGWTYLLQYVDQENDAEAAREAYTKFLQRYPYCYGYWRKFADYEKKKGDPENVQTVFDQGLKAISLSVDLWLHYINHCKVVYEKDEDKLRAQYERAIQACGLEFRSDRLWENYIKWETEGKRLNKVLALYDRLLCTPTMGYVMHFETFQEFVSSNAPQRILSVDNFLALRQEVRALLKSDDQGNAVSDDAPPGEDAPPDEVPPTDEETRAIREKIISSRRKLHKANGNAVNARWTFEEGIKRPYFHVKPLERCQLKNWKEYLDYEIEQKDHNRIVILFERCLIACALYDEFWMRFIRYLESLKGDYSEKIRDVYTRACTIHHPKTPNLHLQWATFEESQGNFTQAATILENVDNLNLLPNTLQIAYRRINLERRRGDLDKASSLYEYYINNIKNRTIVNHIVVKYARFLCKIRNDIDRAIKVLLKATDKDKENPRLYLQLIDLGLQRTPVDIEEIIGYMDLFIDRDHADLEQRVLFAQRKVEFLEDFSPDIKQVLKAHDQFQKCIKQLKDRKKTKSDDKSDSTPPKKTKTNDQTVAPPPPSMSSQSSYQYGSGTSGPYQSQQQFQGSQYSSQGGYQQGYQQYPPSDPNYANYQNWQYGQGGPQAYGPYNQWGSYNYY